MTSVIAARRRAEEFAALVDGGASSQEPRYRDLLAVVSTLRETTTPAPRAEFVRDLRAALMAEAEVALLPVDRRLALAPHTRTRRDRRVAIAAGTLALVGATSSMAVAAQSALPGDALYPIKRVLERAEIGLEADDSARAQQILANAAGRLDEVSALAQRDTARSGSALTGPALDGTLKDFVAQANEAADLLIGEYAETGDTSAIDELRDFASRSMDTLAALDAVLPTDARDALTRAALALTQIDQRAAAACPVCGGGITELPSMFLAAAASETGLRPQVAPSVVLSPVTGGVDDIFDGALSSAGDTGSQPAPLPSGAPTPARTQSPSPAPTTDDPIKDVTDPILGDEESGEGGVVKELLDGVLGQDGLLGGN